MPARLDGLAGVRSLHKAQFWSHAHVCFFFGVLATAANQLPLPLPPPPPPLPSPLPLLPRGELQQVMERGTQRTCLLFAANIFHDCAKEISEIMQGSDSASSGIPG